MPALGCDLTQWRQRVANGISVDAQTLCTIVAHIHALGDCIGIDGQPMRCIEPIGRQTLRIAASSTGDTPAPYDRRAPPIRIKTGSQPITVSAARETG